jgi:hypothetical protein
MSYETYLQLDPIQLLAITKATYNYLTKEAKAKEEKTLKMIETAARSNTPQESRLADVKLPNFSF